MCTRRTGEDNLHKSGYTVFTSIKASDGTHPNDRYSIGPWLHIKASPLYPVTQKPILAKWILEVESRWVRHSKQFPATSCQWENAFERSHGHTHYTHSGECVICTPTLSPLKTTPTWEWTRSSPRWHKPMEWQPSTTMLLSPTFPDHRSRGRQNSTFQVCSPWTRKFWFPKSIFLCTKGYLKYMNGKNGSEK